MAKSGLVGGKITSSPLVDMGKSWNGTPIAGWLMENPTLKWMIWG